MLSAAKCFLLFIPLFFCFSPLYAETVSLTEYQPGETEELLQKVDAAGFHLSQGYLFGKPSRSREQIRGNM